MLNTNLEPMLVYHFFSNYTPTKLFQKYSKAHIFSHVEHTFAVFISFNSCRPCTPVRPFRHLSNIEGFLTLKYVFVPCYCRTFPLNSERLRSPMHMGGIIKFWEVLCSHTNPYLPQLLSP